MKVECPECKAVEEPTWMRGRASGDLEVKCSACGLVTVCPPAQVAPPPIAPADRTVVCPKCGHGQQNLEACDRCGLLFARWDPRRAEAETDEAAQALWGAIDRAWQEDGPHSAFLEYCVARGLYAYAAQQYGAARRDTAREDRARRALTHLVAVAEQALDAGKPADRGREIRRIKTIMLVVAFLVCASMLLFVLARFLR